MSSRVWGSVFLLGFVLAVLLGWYLLSPLFIDDVVDEDLPFEVKRPVVSDDDKNTPDVSPDPPQVELTTLLQGSFVDADRSHKTSGKALVIEQDGKRFLRFEDFEATNGPDLKVYLATDKEASDFVSLGVLKGNIGNQNYEIPSDVNLETHDEVLIWCRAFSVLFGSAKLS